MRILLALILAGGLATSSCTVTTEKETVPRPPEIRGSEEDLVKELRENPDEWVPYVNLGFYYWKDLRQPGRAKPLYERALEIVGRRVYTAPHYYLGLALHELKDYDSAIREFQDCSQVPPEEEGHLLLDQYYRLSHLRLVEIYAGPKKDPRAAEEHLARYVKLGAEKESLKEAHLLLANLYVDGVADPKKAREHLEALRDLGGDQKKMKSLEGRIQALEKALEEKAAEKSG